jgi:hypothetical protein
MDKGATLIYKCRMCGELHKPIHTPKGHLTLMCVMYDWELPKEWFGVMPHKTNFHICNDGNIGVSDLIGCEFD